MKLVTEIRTIIISIVLLLVSSLSISASAQENESQSSRIDNLRLVVSARVLAPTGRSSWNLLLYSGDGKLVRKITSTDKYDDMNPVFSPDGKTIAFIRMPAKYKNELALKDARYFEVDISGKNLHLSDDGSTAPAWYAKTLELKSAGKMAFVADAAGTSDTIHAPATKMADPTGQYELVTRNLSEPEAETMLSADVPAWLRDIKTGKEDQLTSITGYGATLTEGNEGTFGLEGLILNDSGSPWLSQPPFLMALFWCHLNSTDGNAIFALDPRQPRIYELSPNAASIRFIPGLPAMFVLNQQRYQPLGDSGQTVNTRSLDCWNSQGKRIRFAPELAIFGGASILVPGSENEVYKWTDPMD